MELSEKIRSNKKSNILENMTIHELEISQFLMAGSTTAWYFFLHPTLVNCIEMHEKIAYGHLDMADPVIVMAYIYIYPIWDSGSLGLDISLKRFIHTQS